MPSSRGSSPPRDQSCIFYVSCIGRQVLYHKHHLGGPTEEFLYAKPLLKTYKHYLIYLLKTTLCEYYYYSPNEKTEAWRGLIFKPSVLVLIRAHFLLSMSRAGRKKVDLHTQKTPKHR